VQVATGACSSGQGHRTVYAQIAADALDVPIESIDVIGGDTSSVPFGIGTIASRSTVTAANATHQAAGHALTLDQVAKEAAAAVLRRGERGDGLR
jgi:aerobic carbon-monoxide dehydrogenase large subunit